MFFAGAAVDQVGGNGCRHRQFPHHCLNIPGALLEACDSRTSKTA